jgi:CBS domain-containing protein
MCIGRTCVRNVAVATAEESVWAAAERMHRRGSRELVVVNADREPIGILTDRDLLERVLTKRLNADTTLVRQVMTMDPQTIYQGAPLDAALSLMCGGGIRRLPVVDQDGKLCGLICLDDILLRWARDFRNVSELLKTEAPRAAAEVHLPMMSQHAMPLEPARVY